MTLNPRRFGGALVLAGALTLSGCGGSESEDADVAPITGPAEGVVEVVGSDNPETYQPVIDAFEASHEGITITYSQVPFDQFNPTLQQRLAAQDETIDVYTVDQPRLPQLAAKGFLQDLSDLEDDARAATTESSYEANVFRDKLWSLPMWNSTQMLFFNKTALADAGIEPPSSDPEERWTWEQVAEAGAKAQKAGIKSGLLLEQVEAYYQLQPLPGSLGGGTGITGEDGLSADITNEEWVRAMEWYGETFESGLSPRGVGGFQTGPVFGNGDVAFFVGGPWDIGVFSESKVDWGVAPMPYFEGGEPETPTGSWSLGINPASDNKAAALEFVKFATLDPAGNLATTEATTIIPANSEAEAEYLPRLDAMAGEKSAGVGDIIAYETANTAVARPVTVGYIQFEEVMAKVFADIRNGADASERLEQATGQLEEAWQAIR